MKKSINGKPDELVVVGLGRLGLPWAAVLANAGYHVVGTDLNSDRVQAVNAKQTPFPEPGLAQLLKDVGNRLTATSELAPAVRKAKAIFIMVATPSDSGSLYSIDQVLNAVVSIGNALRDSRHRPLLVINSTVNPGAMAGPIRRSLQQATSSSDPDITGLCYMPELVAIGNIIRGYQHPELVIIGSFLREDAQRLKDILVPVYQSDPEVHILDTTGAELAKLGINSFVASKIAYVNHMAELGREMGVSDVRAMTDAIGADHRIGQDFFLPGAPFGGPCFPRDIKVHAALCDRVGVSSVLPRSVDAGNRQFLNKLAKEANAAISHGGRIAILGMEFKPATGVVAGSPGVEVAKLLTGTTRPLIYDPYLDREQVEALCLDADICHNLEKLVTLATVLLLMTPDKRLASELSPLLKENEQIMTIDPWQLLSGE